MDETGSKGERRVLAALRLLGNHTLLREYQIGERLRIDIFIKNLALAIEVQGLQHSTFNGHFYDSAEAFKAAKQRDRRKADLCHEQGITLVVLEYDEVMRADSAESLLGIILERTKEARSKAGIEKEEDW
jgi:hypothetical protein